MGVADGFTEHGHGAAGGKHLAEQCAGEGGLAAAVGSEQGAAGAARDLTGQVIEDDLVLAHNAKVACINCEIDGE